MLNYILHRAMSSANVPSRFEPTGLDCADGKRPNGITSFVPRCARCYVVLFIYLLHHNLQDSVEISRKDVLAQAVTPG